MEEERDTGRNKISEEGRKEISKKGMREVEESDNERTYK